SNDHSKKIDFVKTSHIWFSLLILLVFSTVSVGYVFAVAPITLTIDNTLYYYDHSLMITVVDPNAFTSGLTTVNAQISSGGISCSFPLRLTDNSGTYQSSYITFTSS